MNFLYRWAKVLVSKITFQIIGYLGCIKVNFRLLIHILLFVAILELYQDVFFLKIVVTLCTVVDILPLRLEKNIGNFFQL